MPRKLIPDEICVQLATAQCARERVPRGEVFIDVPKGLIRIPRERRVARYETNQPLGLDNCEGVLDAVFVHTVTIASSARTPSVFRNPRWHSRAGMEAFPSTPWADEQRLVALCPRVAPDLG